MIKGIAEAYVDESACMVCEEGAGLSNEGVMRESMVFRFTHLFFGNEEVRHEAEMPDWLTHQANRWFLNAHVLSLKAGAHVDSDFWRVERVR